MSLYTSRNFQRVCNDALTFVGSSIIIDDSIDVSDTSHEVYLCKRFFVRSFEMAVTRSPWNFMSSVIKVEDGATSIILREAIAVRAAYNVDYSEDVNMAILMASRSLPFRSLRESSLVDGDFQLSVSFRTPVKSILYVSCQDYLTVTYPSQFMHYWALVLASLIATANTRPASDDNSLLQKSQYYLTELVKYDESLVNGATLGYTDNSDNLMSSGKYPQSAHFSS